jgi:rare lipoprotein A
MKLLFLALVLLYLPCAALAQHEVMERGTAAPYSGDVPATASGEPYNPERMTASHPTLPFGTLVRVRNARNGREVVVRINDRGPLMPGEVMRVSRRVADELRLPDVGGHVELALDASEPTLARATARRPQAAAPAEQPPVHASAVKANPEPTGEFTVQIASFRDRERAVSRAREVRGGWVREAQVDGAMVFRVCYGIYTSAESAAVGREALLRQGVQGFVKSL